MIFLNISGWIMLLRTVLGRTLFRDWPTGINPNFKNVNFYSIIFKNLYNMFSNILVKLSVLNNINKVNTTKKNQFLKHILLHPKCTDKIKLRRV